MRINTNKIYENNRNSNISLIVGSLSLFFLVFSIDFHIIPIKPRIIIMTIMLATYLIQKGFKIKTTYRKRDINWIAMSSLLLIYTLVVTLLNSVEGQENLLRESVNFYLFIVILPFIAIDLFKDVTYFSRCMTYASLIQAIIVILSFLLPNVRMILEAIQDISFDRYNYRIVGLGIAGAGGSVYLYSGLITNVYLIFFQKKHTKILMLSLLTILVSMFLVGRTGFYAGVMLTLYLLFFDLLYKTIKVKKIKDIVFLVIVSVIIGYTSLRFFNTNSLLEHTINRAFETSSTLDVLGEFNKTIPPLSIHTLFGTGVSRGVIDSIGAFVDHDSGYIKRYSAIGLIGAIFSYTIFVVYILNILKKVDKRKKSFILFNLLILMVIEYKEPFVFMLAYPFVLIMLSKLIERNKKTIK